MKFGYCRVSTKDQNTKVQEEALNLAGCERIFTETASGGNWDRPELHRLLDQLRAGDTLTVWKLDRLSRSLKDLLNILEKLHAVGAGFRSTTEAIDTTTPAGRMMMQMVGAFAEFERSIIVERTQAGIKRARAAGRHPGRPAKIKPEQKEEILRALRKGEKTQAELARLFNLHPSAVCRLVARASE
ncbi:MAG: recombinase family protein [Verrucomicrobiota bacterium]